MNQPIAKIENLSKVFLALEAGTSADCQDLTPQPVTYEFIFGIGSAGLNPFEFELGGLSEGDEVVMQVRQNEICRFFGPGRPPIPVSASGRDGFYLKARVLRVARAEAREVVKAMAAMAACSECGGDCCGHGH